MIKNRRPRMVSSARASMMESKRHTNHVARRFKESSEEIEELEDSLEDEIKATIETGKALLDAVYDWDTGVNNIKTSKEYIEKSINKLRDFAEAQYHPERTFSHSVYDDEDSSQLFLFNNTEDIYEDGISEREYYDILEQCDNIEEILSNLDEYIDYEMNANDASYGYTSPWEHEEML